MPNFVASPRTPRPPTLSVVVPATDSPPTLERCLAALRSGDELPDEVIVQAQPSGAGPAEARNRGARRAGSEIVAFVDADVQVHGDAVARIRAAFARDPGLCALFGAYDERPIAAGTVSRFRNLLHHHVHVRSPGPAGTFWAGLGAVRRERLLAAGGFDAERYPGPAVEDVELGRRLHADGERIELDPHLRGTHLKRWSLGDMIATDFSRRAVPWLRLQLEAGETSHALNLGWRHRLSALAALALPAALLARKARLGALAAAALVGLNLRFYALLARAGGARLTLAGVGLHALHHLVSVAAVPAAVAAHAVSRARPGGRLR